MTTPTPPAAKTTAIGSAAAEPVKVEAVVDAAKTDATAAVVVDDKAKTTEAAALTPEQKAAAEKTTADAKATEELAKPFTDVAQLKLGEGQKLDEAVVKDFLPLAKELGLTAKQAQALFEFSTKTGGAAEAARAAKLEESYAAADKAAGEALRADKEIGGAKFEASMALAGKAIRNVLGPEFGEWATSLELKDGSLLGNRVEFARALVKLGSLVKEDSKSGTFSAGGSKEKALHELMYGPGTVQAGPVS
jgi:hypothetical protein